MITKRGRVFWLDLWIGKRRVRRSLHTSERALAIERARDLAAELRAPRSGGIPFSEFSERYLEWARTTKPAYARTEGYYIGVIKSWLDGEKISSLDAITPHDVERLRSFLLTKRIGHGSRVVGRSTANRYCALLRTMFNKARDWGEFSGENPVSRVKFFREGTKIRPLTEGEIERILGAADELALRKNVTLLQRAFPSICRVILNTGLRRSEALNLRWTDVGDDAIVILGKGGKTRAIPLNKEARAMLAGPRSAGFVFNIPGRNSPSLLRRLTATISKNAGVPFHIHLLRHAFASRLLAAGVDVVTISQLLGHSAYMTTLLYSHSNPKLMREAVTKLGHRQVDSSV